MLVGIAYVENQLHVVYHFLWARTTLRQTDIFKFASKSGPTVTISPRLVILLPPPCQVSAYPLFHRSQRRSKPPSPSELLPFTLDICVSYFKLGLSPLLTPSHCFHEYNKPFKFLFLPLCFLEQTMS